MKPQTIFNKVARHLLAQNQKAFHHDGLTCMYRAPDGLRCALGAVIPNRLYDEGLENTGAINAVFDSYPEIAKYFGKDNFHLLRDLQNVHDVTTVAEWPYQLQVVADKHKLSMPQAA